MYQQNVMVRVVDLMFAPLGRYGGHLLSQYSVLVVVSSWHSPIPINTWVDSIMTWWGLTAVASRIPARIISK